MESVKENIKIKTTGNLVIRDVETKQLILSKQFKTETKDQK